MRGAAWPAAAEVASRTVNISLPPYLSVSIPIGSRAMEPSRTGTATRQAVCVADRLYSAPKTAASPPTKPQAAKLNANEIVARNRARRSPAPESSVI